MISSSLWTCGQRRSPAGSSVECIPPGLEYPQESPLAFVLSPSDQAWPGWLGWKLTNQHYAGSRRCGYETNLAHCSAHPKMTVCGYYRIKSREHPVWFRLKCVSISVQYLKKGCTTRCFIIYLQSSTVWSWNSLQLRLLPLDIKIKYTKQKTLTSTTQTGC